MVAFQVIGLLAMLQPRPAALQAALGPLEPAHGCYLGAYIERDPVARDRIPVFENLVGKKHASYFHYVGYGMPFPFEWVKSLRALGRVPHIAWEPNGGLRDIADNGYLRGWAEAAHHAQVPIFLRFASEMNGDWQAWSGDPKLYIEKWRLVARIMHEVAPNVVMVWCPFAIPTNTIDAYYPGDDCVDWVGVNIYSVVRHDGNPKSPAGEDPRDQLRPVYERYSPRKPMAICEYAATHYCAALKQNTTDFALDNMRRMYESLPSQFPRVHLIDWFSVDTCKDKLAYNDYALTSDDRVLALYRGLVARDYFLSQIPIPSAAPAPPPPPVKPSIPLAAAGPSKGTPDKLAIALLGAPPDAVRGRVQILIELPPAAAGAWVTVYVDARVKGVSNMAPYSFSMDADALPAGEHRIRVEVADQSEIVRQTAEASFIIAPAS
jgi:hypothetical protein